MKRDFLLRINRRTLMDVNIPYTKGDCMDTEPIEIGSKSSLIYAKGSKQGSEYQIF